VASYAAAAVELLHAPLLSAALAGMATVALLWLALYRMHDWPSALCAALAPLAPGIAAHAVEHAAFWAFAAMLAWALYMASRYVERSYSLYVFQAGLLIAVALAIDVRVGIFALVLGLGLFASYVREWRRGLCIALVLIFPVVYFALAWTFVRWSFSGTLALPSAGGNLFAAYPVGAAFAFAFLCVAVAPRAKARRHQLVIFASVPIVVGLASLAGMGFSADDAALLGCAATMAAVTQIGPVWLRRVAALALAAACAALSYLMPASPMTPVAIDVSGLQSSAPVDVFIPALAYARYAIALLLAIGVIVLARHSLRRLTGRTI
jgi:hypothetical protein